MNAMLAAVLLCGAAVWIALGSPTNRGTPRSGRGPGQLTTSGESETATEPESVPLVLEMCATLLESGLPLRLVLRIIGANVPGYGSLGRVARALEMNVDWDRAWTQSSTVVRELESTLRFTQLSGAPAAALLRSCAAAARKRGVREAEARGAEFGIKLVVPLGLCALPAFIALGVVPVVISLLPRM
ncbi:MAG: type II secretion system F family protein [Paeniglutamicibacter terrestris]